MKGKKRILIDASSVGLNTDGVTTYIVNLIKHLPQKSFDDFEYWILINPGVVNQDINKIKQSGRFKFIEYRIPPIGPKRDWAMFLFFRKYKSKFDLVHMTTNIYPLFFKGGICTIHDLIFRSYFDGSFFYAKLAQFYIDKVVKRCLTKAKYIIAVSNFTKNDIIKQYNLDDDQKKIEVIHEGWEHIIADDGESVSLEEKMDYTYFFYLGTLRKHKNIHNLLAAFNIACKKIPANVKLAISGNTKHMNIENLKIVNEINNNGQRVIFTGYLSDTELRDYYKNAIALIYPSLAEGFGLPVLEAFYNNCPLLCSNTSSLPEIAGDAALYFEPLDQQDMASAMVKFYDSPKLAAGMKEKGKERLKMFSWIDAAEQTVALYYKYFNTKPHS
ncbi:MAG: glycosyltransferase family 1 protein [Mucilaginibacter sp.]